MAQPETIFQKLKATDWNNPINILIVVGAPFMMFTMGTLFNTGLVLGIAMAISALTLFSKLPLWAKKICHKFPLATDLVFTSLATMGVAAFFGTGLTLGIAAIVCELVLTWAMPKMCRI